MPAYKLDRQYLPSAGVPLEEKELAANKTIVRDARRKNIVRAKLMQGGTVLGEYPSRWGLDAHAGGQKIDLFTQIHTPVLIQLTEVRIAEVFDKSNGFSGRFHFRT